MGSNSQFCYFRAVKFLVVAILFLILGVESSFARVVEDSRNRFVLDDVVMESSAHACNSPEDHGEVFLPENAAYLDGNSMPFRHYRVALPSNQKPQVSVIDQKTVPLKNPEETPYKDMPTEDVEGYRYIGFLEIPSISLSLPVMEDWDYNRLKVSPCRYSGSYYTDDLVICAHNYYRHFTPVKDSLGMGEDVYFTNVMGESIHYKTVNKETVQPMDINAMVSNYRNSTVSSNEWDLTLFTCNLGGQTRAAIRCRRVQP